MEVKRLMGLAERWRVRGKELHSKYPNQTGHALETMCETHAEELEDEIRTAGMMVNDDAGK